MYFQQFRLRLVLVGLCLVGSQQIWAQEDFSATLAGDPCGPLTASFTPTVDAGRTVSGYLWNFGNGNTSTLEAPSASYVTANSYTVSLTVTYTDGTEQVSKADFIEIFPSPTVNFVSDIQGGCTPLAVTFTDNSTAPAGATIATRLWEFEGGGSATQATETVTFTDPGTYDVTLYVETNQGCSESVTIPDFIIAEDQVAPSFTPTQQQISSSDSFTVDFANTTPGTDGGNYVFAWDFGDGNTSNEVAPTHTYTSPGDYTVSLTLEETLSGCVGGTETRVDLVRVVDYQPGFTANPTTGCNPLAVQFSDTSALQIASQRVTWDFGDGSPTVSGVGTGGIRTPSHTYTAAGNYTVTMTVEDTTGSCDGAVSVAGLITVPDPVIASYTADERFFCEDNFTVNFTNTSVNGISYSWDFGDGNNSTAPNPSHTFTANGIYLVALTATSATGCTDTFVDTVFSIPIEADFLATNTDGCAPVTTDLVNTSTSIVPLTGFSWEIRDQTNAVVFTSTDENPIGVVLSDAGDYTVTFVASSASCSDTLEQIIQVGLPPLSMDFVASDTAICNGETVNFTNLTVEDGTNPFPVNYEWEYFDGAGFVPGNPNDGSFLYANLDSGDYDVSLLYVSNGCTQVFTRPDYISISTPRANFELTTDLCAPDSLWGENLSVGDHRWLWEILDSTGMVIFTDSVNRDLDTSLTAGVSYVVSLTAYNDSSGCTDVYTETIQLPDPLPNFGISIAEDTVCVDQTITVGSSAIADNYFWTFSDSTNVVTISGDTVTPFFDIPGLYDLTLELTINGCVLDTTWEDAFRIADPLVQIGADTLQGCAPLIVNFYDLSISDVDILSYAWTIGTDTISTDSSFAYTFDSARNPQSAPYTVSLTVTTVDSCVSTRSVEVSVTEPFAEFLLDSVFTCEGVRLDLTANAADSVLFPDPDDSVTYQWFTNAPGVALPFAQNSSAIFPNGTFDVSLRLQDINGCTDSIGQTVTINRELPQAAFSADPTEVFCPPAAVNFFDESVQGNSGIETWSWTFGDGATSGLTDPLRVFQDPGVYDVTLVITDSAGCIDTLTRENYVDIQGPTGSFTVDDSLGYAPLPISFMATSPDDSVTYLWDFANGQVDGFFEESFIDYTYPGGGSFTPIMTIRDERGCDFAPDPEVTILVLDCPTLDLGPDLIACTQEETLSLDGYNTTHEITLGTLFYEWNTGETVSALVPPKQVGVSEYILNMWIIDDEGNRVCEVADTANVIYNATPVAEYSVTNPCLGEASTFLSTSTISAGAIAQYQWTTGDGQPDQVVSNDSILHFFAQLGNFTTQLIVTSDSGCMDTAMQPVNVLEVPGVDVITTDACVGSPHVLGAFPNSDIGQEVSLYRWDSDLDGNFEEEGELLDEISITQTVPGTYQAQVQLVADNGCFTYDTLTYETHPLPEITFSPQPALVCEGSSLTLRVEGTESYRWEDGTTRDSLIVSPDQDTTYYAVVGTNAFGCTTTDSIDVAVLRFPFLPPETRGCVGDTLVLNASIPGVEVAYEWSTGDTDDRLLVTNPGVYSVEAMVLEEGVECLVSSQTTAFFDIPTVLPVSDVTVCFDDVSQVLLDPGLNGEYLWQPDGLTDSVFSAVGPDTVTLVFTNLAGCVSDTVIRVFENCIPQVTFPNAFTPNGDGLNDVLLPQGQYFINYRAEIFNRWGELVFVTENADEGWDGLRPDGNPHLSGVYMIVLVFENQFDPGVPITSRHRVWLID
ncbi:MAG: PKD domain-containing protein [Bacteroidota bacterium]